MQNVIFLYRFPPFCSHSSNVTFHTCNISRSLRSPLDFLLLFFPSFFSQHIHMSSLAHAETSALLLPEVPSHITPTLIIKGRGVRVDPLSVQLRAGDPLIHSPGFVWASGLTHLPTPQASAGPWSEGQLLFSSNNCS